MKQDAATQNIEASFIFFLIPKFILLNPFANETESIKLSLQKSEA
jgi:hypothetical protein